MILHFHTMFRLRGDTITTLIQYVYSLFAGHVTLLLFKIYTTAPIAQKNKTILHGLHKTEIWNNFGVGR